MEQIPGAGCVWCGPRKVLLSIWTAAHSRRDRTYQATFSLVHQQSHRCKMTTFIWNKAPSKEFWRIGKVLIEYIVDFFRCTFLKNWWAPGILLYSRHSPKHGCCHSFEWHLQAAAEIIGILSKIKYPYNVNNQLTSNKLFLYSINIMKQNVTNVEGRNGLPWKKNWENLLKRQTSSASDNFFWLKWRMRWKYKNILVVKVSHRAIAIGSFLPLHFGCKLCLVREE